MPCMLLIHLASSKRASFMLLEALLVVDIHVDMLYHGLACTVLAQACPNDVTSHRTSNCVCFTSLISTNLLTQHRPEKQGTCTCTYIVG